MQNQANNEYLSALEQLRTEIDAIDDKILELLSQRINVVAKVKDVKSKNNEGFFIKSAREADMIKSLVSRSNKNIPEEIIASIWRKIITSSNIFEQPIKISLLKDREINDYKYVLWQYYASLVPILSHKSFENVILDLESNKAQIAAIDISCEQNWWINFAYNQSGIKIFAKISSFDKEDELNLLLLAKKPQEKSQNDITFLCFELEKSTSKSQLLSEIKKNNLEARILKSGNLKSVESKNFYFVEIKGFLQEGDDALKKLESSDSRPFIKVLGVCPA